MELLYILVFAAFIKGLEVCNNHVCLTWTVQENYLDLRCRVNYLIYGVEFFNNRKKEQGFCLHPKPTPKCFASNNNTIIMQNPTTNVTYLKILGQIDSQFNGQWECKHGTNRDSASINVTVLHSDSSLRKAKINDKLCWQSYLAYTMFGFFCTVFVCLILFVVCRYKLKEIRKSVYQWCKIISSFERCSTDIRKRLYQRCKRIYNSERCPKAPTFTKCIRMFTLLIPLVLCLIPVVKGAVDRNICKDEELYIIVGVIIAVLFAILIANEMRDKDIEKQVEEVAEHDEAFIEGSKD